VRILTELERYVEAPGFVPQAGARFDEPRGMRSSEKITPEL